MQNPSQQPNPSQPSQQQSQPSQQQNPPSLPLNFNSQQQQPSQVSFQPQRPQTPQKQPAQPSQPTQNPNPSQPPQKPARAKSARQAYIDKIEAYRQTEAYKKYHGPDPIRTKPYNYEQMCMHEQIYTKAAYFKFKEWKKRDDDYDRDWVKKRPKQWQVKENPNRWFSNANPNSFHKEAPKLKEKYTSPNQVFNQVHYLGEDTTICNQNIPYKRLYIDYDNIEPPRLETQYMGVQHQMVFTRDDRQGRVIPHYQSEITTYNENLPYSVQNNQNNIYNTYVNQNSNPSQSYQDNYGNPMSFTQPMWHPPAQTMHSYSFNQQQQQGYPFNQYRYY